MCQCNRVVLEGRSCVLIRPLNMSRSLSQNCGIRNSRSRMYLSFSRSYGIRNSRSQSYLLLSQSCGSRNSRSRMYLSLSQSYRSLKSFVGISTGYELDGPRFESRLDHQSLTDAVLLRACLLLSSFFKAFKYNVDNV
jgi:hypothetical protein